MPQKSPSEIEDEIERAIIALRSLDALGLWIMMMRWTDPSSKACGKFRCDGVPLNVSLVVERVATQFCQKKANRVPRIVEKLQAATVRLNRQDVPVLRTTDDGCLYSPALDMVATRRQRHNENENKSHRKRRGSDDSLKGVRRESDGSQTPSLEVSPLNPLPNPSPLRTHCAREAEIRQAESIAEIRRFATNWLSANHPNWLRKVGSLIEMFQALGKQAGIEAAEIAIAEARGNPSVRDPFAYALPKALERANGSAKSNGGRNGRHQPKPRSAIAVAGREDN